MNYYRRYSGDYLRKTARLSMTEHGAYTLMLDYYYSEDKPLPLDQEEIFTMCRAMKPADKAAILKILSLFFNKTDDGYHNERADEELAAARPAIEAARSNGKKGGRRLNPIGNPPGNGSNNPPGNLPGNHIEEPSGLPNGQHGGQEAGQHPPSSILQPLPTNPQPPTPNRQGKAEARATRLPSDWALPFEWRTWAMQDQGWTAERALKASDRFRDYWIAKPGKDGRKLDWEATWRNWCRNEKGMGGNGKATVAERNEQAAQDWLNGSGPRVIEGNA